MNPLLCIRYGQLAYYATCFIYVLCFSYCHHHVSYFQESTSPGTLLLRDHPRDTHYLVLFQVRWLRLTALPNIKEHPTRAAPQFQLIMSPCRMPTFLCLFNKCDYFLKYTVTLLCIIGQCLYENLFTYFHAFICTIIVFRKVV